MKNSSEVNNSKLYPDFDSLGIIISVKKEKFVNYKILIGDERL